MRKLQSFAGLHHIFAPVNVGVAGSIRSRWFLMFSTFFFNDTATTEIYPLSLHDALPICLGMLLHPCHGQLAGVVEPLGELRQLGVLARSEEHTSELQSLAYLASSVL